MEHPSCPRCGYDLTGIVQSWTDSYPLNGVCSECGLAFAWMEVLAERLAGPRWFIEHSVRIARPMIATLLATFLPLLLWRRIRLVHEIRPRRLVLFVVGWLLTLHVIESVTVCALGNLYLYRQLVSGLGYVPYWPQWNALFCGWAWVFDFLYLDEPESVVFLLPVPFWILCMPALYFLFSDSLRIEPVRFIHLARITALSIPAASLLMWPVFGLIFLPAFAPSIPPWAALLAFLGIAFGWPLWYWYEATRSYLRLHRPALAVAVLGVAAIIIDVVLIIGVATVISAIRNT